MVALTVLAALAYRYLLFWDPSSAGSSRRGVVLLRHERHGASDRLRDCSLPALPASGKAGPALGREGSPLLALPLLGTGFALFLWAHYVDAPDLLLVSFLPFCLGSALLLFGAPFTREMAFPVLFLAFALPIPGVLTNQIVFPLQLWNAELVAQLLNIAGIPVVQEGDMLYLADRSFEIIETCSGLRAIVVLTMLAVGLVCYFPARWLHLVLLVASACADCLLPERRAGLDRGSVPGVGGIGDACPPGHGALPLRWRGSVWGRCSPSALAGGPRGSRKSFGSSGRDTGERAFRQGRARDGSRHPAGIDARSVDLDAPLESAGVAGSRTDRSSREDRGLGGDRDPEARLALPGERALSESTATDAIGATTRRSRSSWATKIA